MKLLDGKVCIITGAGSGVGRASAVLFAEHGARVVIAELREEWAKGTLDLVNAVDGDAIVVHCDVSDEPSVEAMVAAAAHHYGRLDVMFNNAGVSTPRPGLKFVDHTAEDWQRLVAINLMGMVWGCKHAILQFQRQGGGGVIVNTGSVAGMVGWGGVPYGVTKAGDMQLTRGLAIELAADNIRVNSFAPGSMLSNFGRSEEDAFKPHTDQEYAAWGSLLPTGRPTMPEDCAHAALFLASDWSANITGVTLPVDGGYVAR
jgi:NAD(P)-dependent dehydrogenase (short-subunit alcohol dehydrogenase family)